jgi:hypothetical protein
MSIDRYDGESGSFEQAQVRGGLPILRYDGDESEWRDMLLSDGLVCYFPSLSEFVTDSVVEDLSGDGNDAEIVGDPIPAPGPVGESLQMDGDLTYLEAPNDPTLDVQGGDFTIAGWFTIDELVTTIANTNLVMNKAVGKGDEESGPQLGVSGGGGNETTGANALYFVFGDGSTKYSTGDALTANLHPDTDYHVIVTWESSSNTATVYVDGVEVGSKSFDASPVGEGDPWFFAAHHTVTGTFDQTLDGRLGPVRIVAGKAWNEPERRAAFLQGYENDTAYRARPVEQLFGPLYEDAVADYQPDDENPYKLVMKYDDRRVELHESSDLSSWARVTQDVSPTYDVGAGDGPQDMVTVDGTKHLYYTHSGADMRLFSGPSLTDLTDQGIVFDGETDGGAYHDGDTYYLFTETFPAPGPSGNGIRAHTSSNPDGPWTDEGAIVDVSDENWFIGDPEVVRVNGEYWLLTDRDVNHPDYVTAMWRSDDLLSGWTLTDDHLNAGWGGDMEVIDDGETIHAFTEFYGSDQAGVGRWEVVEM